MDDSELPFSPPPFNADNAWVQLKKQLRDLKLSERGNGFELRGKRVAELQLDGVTIAARMARKLAMTPEWDKAVITNADGQRQWIGELKKRLARWDHEE